MSNRRTPEKAGPPTPKGRRDAGPNGMVFEQVPIGGKRNLAYIIGDGAANEVALVDVGFNPGRVLGRVKALGAKVKLILATHGHRDHVGAAPALKKATGA